jgi:hypothetical protein
MRDSALGFTYELYSCSVALACKGPLNARLATGVDLSFFLSCGLCELQDNGTRWRCCSGARTAPRLLAPRLLEDLAKVDSSVLQ